MPVPGPPGEEHHLLPGGGFHRLHLEGGVGEALVPLDLHQQVLQVVWGAELPPSHGQQGVGHIGLTVVELVQVAGVLPGDGVPDDPPLVQQVLEAGLHGVGLPQQPLGCGQELGVGGERRGRCPGYGPGCTGSPPPAGGGPPGEPQVHGQLVRRGKGRRTGGPPSGGRGLARRAFRARSPYRRYRGVAMDRGRLWAERKSSRRRMDSCRQRDWWMVSARLGEMPHLGQLLGGSSSMTVRISSPKTSSSRRAGGGADALDGPGGQVFQQSLLPHGHPPLHDFGLKLLPRRCCGGSTGRGRRGPPRGSLRHGAHHGDLLPPRRWFRGAGWYSRSPRCGRSPRRRFRPGRSVQREKYPWSPFLCRMYVASSAGQKRRVGSPPLQGLDQGQPLGGGPRPPPGG